MILFRRCSTSVLSLILFLLLSLPATTQARHLHSGITTEPREATAGTVMRGRASWYGRELQGRRTTSGERFNRLAYTCAHKTLPFGTRLRVTSVKNGKSVVVRVSDRGPFRHQRIIDLAELAARPLGITECGAATVIAEVVAPETPLGPATAPANWQALYAADPLPSAPYTTYLAPLEPVVPETSASIAAGAIAQAALSPAAEAAASGALVAATLPADATTCPVSFLVQAGSFLDPANATALQARIQSLDPSLRVELSEDLLDGRQRSRVLVGTYGERPEAEALRRRLLVWGIGGLVREVALR